MLSKDHSIALKKTFSLSFTSLMLALPQRVTKRLYTARLTLHKEGVFPVYFWFIENIKEQGKNSRQYLGRKRNFFIFTLVYFFLYCYYN